MTREELIAALERAEGPSRELDGVIDDMTLERGWRQERMVVIYGSPPYTSSLDAALTLVPEGHYWAVYRSGMAYVKPDEDGPHERDLAAAPTPALALCAAALKARV